MTVVAFAFIVALVLSLGLTPLVRCAALYRGTVEAPGTSFRKIHDRDVPRIGGVAIVIAFYFPLLCLLAIDSEAGAVIRANRALFMGLLLGGLPIVALGIYDDVRGAGASIKFTVQFVVATALYLAGFRIDIVTLPLGHEFAMGAYAFPLTVLWFVGLINALNLIDGLDGLAAGVTTVAAAAIFLVAFANGDLLAMLFVATLAGALIGFLFFNFNPATIFMGDTGSLFIGYVIAVASLQGSTTASASVALLTPLLALGLPIFDTSMALIRRLVRGQHPFQGDREHIHHRLLDMGFSHRGAVLALYLVAAMFAAFAILVHTTEGWLNGGIVLVAAMTVGLLTVRMRLVEFDQQQLVACRRRNRRLRRSQLRFAARVGESLDLDDTFAALVEALRELEVAQIEMRPSPTRRSRRWCQGDADDAVFSVERRLRGTDGVLWVAWNDGRRSLGAAEGGALDRLVATLEQRLQTRPARHGLIVVQRTA